MELPAGILSVGTNFVCSDRRDIACGLFFEMILILLRG
jgi:hypothetical protein